MKYSKVTYEKVKATLNIRRKSAEDKAKDHHDKFAEKCPDLLLIENAMSATGLETVNAVLKGVDAEKAIARLAKQNLSLQADREKLLRDFGLDKNYLTPQYTCKKCNDTGYCDGKMCECQTELLKKFSCEMLSDNTPLKLSSFSDFSLSFYQDTPDSTGISPKKRMSDILNLCREYADDFDRNSPSLFMYGETGLGKTHLSLAIAGEVIEKGYSVIYDSAQNLLNKLEREHFSRFDSSTYIEDSVFECDLLIIDDLGAEFETRFTISEIYNIINTRLSAGMPTIISSNISLEELTNRYSARITSRIIGTYELLLFCGKDIRQIKKHM